MDSSIALETAGCQLDFLDYLKLLWAGSSNRIREVEIKMSGTAVAILAIIAGILILFNWLPLQWVIGIFLIVWGILALMGKK